jgi:putative NADH-flavin reductase
VPAGRLGRHVVIEALARGHTVHAAVHRSNPLPAHPRLQIRIADAHCLETIRTLVIRRTPGYVRTTRVGKLDGDRLSTL